MSGKRIIHISLEDETIREESVEDFSIEGLYSSVDGSSFALCPVGDAGLVALYVSRQSGKLARDFARCRMAAILSSLGIAAIVVRGAAHKLSYLYASDDDLAIYHCENIRFSSPERFAQLLSSDTSDGYIAIGEAGERLSPLATCYLDSTMTIGRGGLAATMGEVNFKGIVCHSISSVCEPTAFKLGGSTLAKNLSVYGSSSVLDYGLANGWLTVKWYQGYYEPRAAHLDGRMESRVYSVEHYGCPTCQIACHLRDSETGLPLPDWRTASSLGCNLGIFSIGKVARLERRCALHGLDPVDTGEVLSYLATRDDLPYTMPNVKGASVEELERVISLIGERRGIGEAVSAGLSALDGAPSIAGRSIAFDLRGAHAQVLFSLMGENSPCYVDLVKNLRKSMDAEMVGRTAAWLRVFTHGMENTGLPPFLMLPLFFEKKNFKFASVLPLMRRMMRSFARCMPGVLEAGLASVRSYDSLYGELDELPSIFTLPSVVGYTDEVNIVKLTLGYRQELAYLMSMQGA